VRGACANDELHEIKSPLILQPGPGRRDRRLDALGTGHRGWAAR